MYLNRKSSFQSCLSKEDLEIPVPRYFIRERNKVLQDRERMFAAILNQMDVTEKAGMSSIANVSS